MRIKQTLTLVAAFVAVTSVIPVTTSCVRDEVITEDPEDGGGQTPVTPSSSAMANRVYEWIPAPGQFINDPTGGNAWPADMTPAQANEWALKRINDHYTVSLGAFGGYIVVGFDHSISNVGGYEIGVLGNAFNNASGNSNEPGIVYVMQDSNRNGLPDDTWYELKGSDTFAPGTIRNYEVTYYKPAASGEDIKWTDNLGNSGVVPYVGTFHSQDSYYPVWVKTDRYTLVGTCLEARSEFNPETGNWSNHPFEWGYADNMGSDVTEYDGFADCNRFRISDAINEDGKPVELKYIDFVKIQTGVSSVSGWLGEVSTEVLGVIDLTLKK